MGEGRQQRVRRGWWQRGHCPIKVESSEYAANSTNGTLPVGSSEYAARVSRNEYIATRTARIGAMSTLRAEEEERGRVYPCVCESGGDSNKKKRKHKTKQNKTKKN